MYENTIPVVHPSAQFSFGFGRKTPSSESPCGGIGIPHKNSVPCLIVPSPQSISNDSCLCTITFTNCTNFGSLISFPSSSIGANRTYHWLAGSLIYLNTFAQCFSFDESQWICAGHPCASCTGGRVGVGYRIATQGIITSFSGAATCKFPRHIRCPLFDASPAAAAARGVPVTSDAIPSPGPVALLTPPPPACAVGVLAY